MSDTSQFVTNTKEKLSRIVTKTPLTEKLLSKPPVNFVKDVIIEILEKTNFGMGLFSEEERRQKLTEKDQKLAFLQKIINFVQEQSGKRVAAKPSKIIAGLDPEETCAFLGLLAEISSSNVKRNDAVQGSTELSHKPSQDLKQPKRQTKEMSKSIDKISIPKTSVTDVRIKSPEERSIDRKTPVDNLSSPSKVAKVIAKEDQNPTRPATSAKKISDNSTSIANDQVALKSPQVMEVDDYVLIKSPEIVSPTPQTNTQDKEASELKAALRKMNSILAPVTKVLDYLQADFEAMDKEFDHWVLEEQKYKPELIKVKEETRMHLESYSTQFETLEQVLQEQKRKIEMKKAVIAENDSKIRTLLSKILEIPTQ